ncbi:MAG TPA: hypothetical protein VNS55_12090 [Nocardioides sp.]|nr:hypothetical protein [Nocardioides sp.]
MKLITTGVATVALAAGVAGSVAAYRTQSAQDVAVTTPTSTSTDAAQPVASDPPRRKVRWAPCPDGSKLEKGVCVTDVVRTVVVPAPAAPAPAPAPVPVAANAGTSAGEGDDGGRDDSPYDDHDESDDHDGGEDGPDDHGDDRGEDDHDDD